MPGPHCPSVACGGGGRCGAAVPVDKSAWTSASWQVVRHRRCAGRQETGSARGLGCREVRGPFAEGWTCYQCGDRGGVRTLDHEANWASERADGAAVYPRRELVSGELGGEAWLVAAMTSKRQRPDYAPLGKALDRASAGLPDQGRGHRQFTTKVVCECHCLAKAVPRVLHNLGGCLASGWEFGPRE